MAPARVPGHASVRLVWHVCRWPPPCFPGGVPLGAIGWGADAPRVASCCRVWVGAPWAPAETPVAPAALGARVRWRPEAREAPGPPGSRPW